jgi:hypothetical protein
MTLVEILIVVSMVSFISVAIYHSLSSGVNVWKRSHKLTTEEDIIVFFDKMTTDLRNFYPYSKMKFKGSARQISFPAIVYIPADKKLDLPEGSYVDQLGMVEYAFDSTEDKLSKRQANYSQALKEKFGPSVVLINQVEKVEFKYVYMTDDGEQVQESLLETFPSWIEVHVEFRQGNSVHRMAKYIEIPKAI